KPDRIILIGEHTRSARIAVPAELADRVIDLGGHLPFDALLDSLVTGPTGAGSLAAIGNIHGQGEILLDKLRALPTAPFTPHPLATAMHGSLGSTPRSA
ncbi:MAG: hypothetical protein LC799_05520, partial [Actinobacteria bacterium]|nr:hypothetical protein [Actinomycetota bacterium]